MLRERAASNVPLEITRAKARGVGNVTASAPEPLRSAATMSNAPNAAATTRATSVRIRSWIMDAFVHRLAPSVHGRAGDQEAEADSPAAQGGQASRRSPRRVPRRPRHNRTRAGVVRQLVPAAMQGDVEAERLAVGIFVVVEVVGDLEQAGRNLLGPLGLESNREAGRADD